MLHIRVMSIQANKENGQGRPRRRRGWAHSGGSEIASAPCSLCFPSSTSDIQVIFQLRSIDTLEYRGYLLFTAVFHHQAYPSRLLPPSLLWDGGSTQCIHSEGPEALISPISALRDDRVKDRQEVNLPETRVLLWWGEEGYCSPLLAFFP